MQIVKDTRLEHGVLYYPLRPPSASMLVVVKATYVLRDGGPAELAEVQDPATGELYHDDDPQRSVRYPSDFALLKPRGECFVTGSCRPLTAGPVDRSLAGFEIGSVRQSFNVYGDRRWAGGQPSRPMPWKEMPLSWERAFGGPGFDANPLGRGIEPDADGNVWLPNIELASEPITSRDQRPSPAGAFAIGATWKSRRRLLGTYDEAWRRTRFPWLATDFRFAYFNEAPDALQIQGYWRGDEAIALSHLHPELPSVRTRLPALVARAFVEHAEDARGKGAFEEIPLALDTITIDADRGLALAVWRGTLELAHPELRPDGLARLFVTHEAAGARATVEACRDRMRAKLAADEAAGTELAGEEPPPVDDALQTQQLDASPEMAVLMAQAAAIEREAKAKAEVEEAAGLFAKLEAQMRAAGVDPAKLTLEAEAAAPAEPHLPPDPKAVKAAFEAMGEELPAEVEEVLAALAAAIKDPPAPYAPPAAPRIDLRQQVIDAHAALRPLRGDFTGVDLMELDLRGLDARDAILAGASARGANLSRARLDGANLAGADLLAADLSGASLKKADLTRAVLEVANLTEANLEGAMLAHAELEEAVLDRAILRKADLTRARLSRASLVAAVCDEATFDGAQMGGSKCVEASFVEARFYGVVGRKMNMDRAVVTRIRVGRGADLSGTSFKSAAGAGSRWRDSKLEAVNFAGATLDQADFTGATLTSANLAGCPLSGAVFQGAKLLGAGLARANVFEGSFREADLSGADLSGANLYSVDFFQAQAEGVVLDGANLDGTMWETT